MTDKNKGGRPLIVLNPQQKAEIETLAAVLTTEQIADYFGIGKTTFFEILDRDPEVSELYKKGRAKGERKGLAAFSKNKKEKKPANNASRSTNKPVQEETRANNAPVGFGENIPAFLKDTPQ